jgi:hypothetical protein
MSVLPEEGRNACATSLGTLTVWSAVLKFKTQAGMPVLLLEYKFFPQEKITDSPESGSHTTS